MLSSYSKQMGGSISTEELSPVATFSYLAEWQGS